MRAMRAVVITDFGGPEVMELVEDHPTPEPADGQVLIKVSRVGINFADTHARENSYLASYELPLIPGAEVAGFVGGQRVVGLVGMAATPSTRWRRARRSSRCPTASPTPRRSR